MGRQILYGRWLVALCVAAGLAVILFSGSVLSTGSFAQAVVGQIGVALALVGVIVVLERRVVQTVGEQVDDLKVSVGERVDDLAAVVEGAATGKVGEAFAQAREDRVERVRASGAAFVEDPSSTTFAALARQAERITGPSAGVRVAISETLTLGLSPNKKGGSVRVVINQKNQTVAGANWRERMTLQSLAEDLMSQLTRKNIRLPSDEEMDGFPQLVADKYVDNVIKRVAPPEGGP